MKSLCKAVQRLYAGCNYEECYIGLFVTMIPSDSMIIFGDATKHNTITKHIYYNRPGLVVCSQLKGH